MDLVLARQLREQSPAAHRIPSVGQSPHRTLIEPFDVLFEDDVPRHQMRPELERIYGRLGFADSVIYSNFVSSVDGVVSLGSKPSAGSVISGRNQADRFLMGLLRAFADAVLVGAGTVRAEGGRALWTPEFIFPAAADAFRELRRTLKREASPRLVIVSARGDLDPDDRALQTGALVLTTEASANRLRAKLPAATEIRAMATDETIAADAIFSSLAADGYRTIL